MHQQLVWHFVVTSVVQCVSDPTNTQNVIVADYAKVDVNDILKSTLPYTMVMALENLDLRSSSIILNSKDHSRRVCFTYG